MELAGGGGGGRDFSIPDLHLLLARLGGGYSILPLPTQATQPTLSSSPGSQIPNLDIRLFSTYTFEFNRLFVLFLWPEKF